MANCKGSRFVLKMDCLPKDIVGVVQHILHTSYLNDWKHRLHRVHQQIEIHIGITFRGYDGINMEFGGITWWRHKNEDPEDFDHDFNQRSFNYRDLADDYEDYLYINQLPHPVYRQHQRLVHIAHVPTQTSTMIELPKHYYRTQLNI